MRLGAQFLDDSGVLIAHHRHAGGGGNHPHLRILVEAHQALGLREGLAAEACIGVHLPATGLLGVKLQFYAQPLQQAYHSPARLRV